MSRKIFSFAMALATAVTIVVSPPPSMAQEPAVVPAEAPRAVVEFAVATDDISGVRIIEESPGRFIAEIRLAPAKKTAFTALTSAHVGEDVQVTIAGEPVVRTEIRGPIDAILIGPWMNKGLANLFARCIERCGPTKCL